MICIECATPVSSLYTYYSDDNINVTKCANCGLFVDKYIEGEPILAAIDLLLLRPAAVRHVVFNATAANPMECAPGCSRPSPPAADEKVKPVADDRPLPLLISAFRWEGVFHHLNATWWGVPVPVLRLIVLAVLFNVYQQWALYEKSSNPLVQQFLAQTAPAFQYGMFLALCCVDTFLTHLTVRTMASMLLNWKNGGAISTALLIGSFSRLLPILTFIWHYDMPLVAHMVRYAVIFCVVEVLTITLNCGYMQSIVLTLSGLGVSVAVNYIFWAIVRTVS